MTMVDAPDSVINNVKHRIIDGLRLLTASKVLYGAGHLSARIPGTQAFIINPRYPGNLADVEDLCIVDIASGKRISGPGPIPSETHIHNEIFKARPDVESVTHVHARWSTLWSVMDRDLPMINGAATAFADGVGVYPDSAGVRTAEEGRKVAEALGDRYAVFQRGHGVNIAGPGIEGTVMLAIQLEELCQDAFNILPLGGFPPIRSAGFPGGKERRNKRLQNDYRTWPFLLEKYHIRDKETIKGAIKSPGEGEHM